jgi:DNA adenine methylase
MNQHASTVFLSYVGSKSRIAPAIGQILRSTGADTLVDVFGGSASVMLKAGFEKRIYNDGCGDLVNLLRTIADPALSPRLYRVLRALPPSREIYNRDAATYAAGGLSFSRISDPIDRARATFYRAQFCFGGKMRNGGFQISSRDRHAIKEVARYRTRLRSLVRLRQFFQGTVIENLSYQDCVRISGAHSNHVLYCDPPYVGTESYYSCVFTPFDHVNLADALQHCAAKVVVSYYDCPTVRDLYPPARWEYHTLRATKNSSSTWGQKEASTELVLVRKEG